MKRRVYKKRRLALSAAFVPNIAFPSFLRGVLRKAVPCTTASPYLTFGHQEILV